MQSISIRVLPSYFPGMAFRIRNMEEAGFSIIYQESESAISGNTRRRKKLNLGKNWNACTEPAPLRILEIRNSRNLQKKLESESADFFGGSSSLLFSLFLFTRTCAKLEKCAKLIYSQYLPKIYFIFIVELLAKILILGF